VTVGGQRHVARLEVAVEESVPVRVVERTEQRFLLVIAAEFRRVDSFQPSSI